jgi:hypothetical protein
MHNKRHKTMIKPTSNAKVGLGDNPTVLFIEHAQVSAHFFAYSQRDGGQLTGGEVVRLSPSLLPEEDGEAIQV